MKKILCLLLCAILIISNLTACSDTEENIVEESNAYELYTKMLAVMAEVKSIDMEIAALNDVFIDDDESNGAASGNIKKAANRQTGGNDVAINFSIGINEDIVSTAEIYYTDGILYYTDASGLKMSSYTPYEQVPFLSHADLLEFPESAVKEFNISNHNGGKKVEMTLDGNSVASILEKNQDAENYNLSDVVCEFIIDENNMLLFHRIIYEENMDNMRVKRDISITVNSYNDVKIEPTSDLDEYTNIDFYG
jgi:putative cell wall-binding protein